MHFLFEKLFPLVFPLLFAYKNVYPIYPESIRNKAQAGRLRQQGELCEACLQKLFLFGSIFLV
jgi:hypothetical protein